MAPRVTFTGLAIFALALVVLLPARGATPNPRFSITIEATEHTTWTFDACVAWGPDGSCQWTYDASGTDDSTIASQAPTVVTLNGLKDAARLHQFHLSAHTDRSVNGAKTASDGRTIPADQSQCGARDFPITPVSVYAGYDPGDLNTFELHIFNEQRVYSDACTPLWVTGFAQIDVSRPLPLSSLAAHGSTVVSGHDTLVPTDMGPDVKASSDVSWTVRIKRL
jgi:hypothetical protein